MLNFQEYLITQLDYIFQSLKEKILIISIL